jgi:hypothetical protein
MRTRDSGPRRTVLALLGLLALVLCVMLLAYWQVGKGGPAGFSQAQARPDLQTAPQDDLGAYRKEKQDELDATGPVPGSPGYVRIPVDRAMSLMTGRGLRARSDPAARQGAPQ